MTGETGLLAMTVAGLSHNRASGSILVLAIWILVFFSILCTGLYGIVSSQIMLAKRVEYKIIGKYLARAAVLYAQEEAKADETPYDTLYELRRKKERELGIGKFSYVLIDEESKININTSPVEVVASLPGLNLELAEKLNSSTLRPFHFKEEMLLVDEVTEEVFERCKAFITIYGEGKVNMNTAPPEVLRALGMDEELVKIVVDFRKGEDYNEATEDDGVFENTGEILNRLRAFKTLFEAQQAVLLSLISKGLIGVGSKTFSMQIEASVLDKQAMRYVVVMDEEKVKEWREN